MNIITYTKTLVTALLITTIAGKIYGSTVNTIAYPSEYAVAVKSGDLYSFLNPDNTVYNTYTVTKGTTLIFEVDGRILSKDDVGVLSSEWYSSERESNGKALQLLGWWWWVDGKKNDNAPAQAPNKPNTPDAMSNTGKKGLFVFEHTFDKVTPYNSPTKITAVLYPVKIGTTSMPATVEFFVNVQDSVDVL